ncbi:hypothetical protein GCM10009737_07810 [Nocardioides lentus]|uniref:Hydroxylaminobenzene mutase n=1 Tax=Nocardioides lentus TaxID=338077 RepID=A0ABN2P1X3_9ACTN
MDLDVADVLVVAGVWSLALGGVSGWAVAAAFHPSALLARVGVRHPRRVLQLHLDWIIMGCVMVAVGLAAPMTPSWALVLVLAGALVNPLLFAPLMFSQRFYTRRSYLGVSLVSFTALSAGLVVAALSLSGALLS